MPRLLRIAFPVALLLFAGFFFGGRLGWWTDDYWHCRRDPITDQVQELIMRRGFFLRPLFYALVPALTTSLWHHASVAHAIELASHGLVVAMLWRLLLMLGLGRRAAGAAALLFMVYPAQFEALFWFAALPTSLSSAVMLGVMMLAVSFSRRGVGWWSVGVMGAMTFAACCLNEQPASVAGVLPVLAWVASKGVPPGAHREPSLGSRAWRTLAPGAVCIAAGLLYVTLLQLSLKNAPPGVRGSAQSLVTPNGLGGRMVYFGDVLWRRLVMKNFGAGALREGWDQISSAGWVSWGAIAGLAMLGVAWALRSTSVEARRPGSDLGDESRAVLDARAQGAGWTLLGLSVFLVGWLPILAMAAYDPDSRCRYWPDVGLAILAAALFHTVGRRLGPDRATIPALRLGLLAVLLAWSVMLVGVQVGFRNRWKLDGAEGAELKRLIPNPVPYTMFIPLAIEERALSTGSPVLDTHFRSVWETPWTTRVFLERAYRREDLRCGYFRHWTPRTPVRSADEAGIHYDDPNFGGPRFQTLADGTSLIPWDRALLFTIGKDGVLRVVTRVTLSGGSGPDVTIDLPQARGQPDHAAVLPRR